MFTDLESEYIKSLVNVYRSKGYKYYLVHTVTERNNEYDMRIYFSKDEIRANTDETFSVKNGIVINVDSSARNDNNSYSIYSRDVLNSVNFNGVVTIHTAEFIYTNALVDYSETSFCINPDILESGVTNYNSTLFSYVLLFLLTIILLYQLVHDVLRFRK